MNWFDWAIGYLSEQKNPDLTPAQAFAINFTPRAQQSLVLARKEAVRRNQNFVGTEHVLLGLIQLGKAGGWQIFSHLGVDPEEISKRVDKEIGDTSDVTFLGHTPYTPRVKKVFKIAFKEAKTMEHARVDTGHLLLALLIEGEGLAGRVLQGFNLSIERVRQEVSKPAPPLDSKDKPTV